MTSTIINHGARRDQPTLIKEHCHCKPCCSRQRDFTDNRLQGASALEKLLVEQRDSRIRVFVIWEPVLPTDSGAPSTATLRRVSDLRASQYWDKEHVVSRLLGERDRRSVVWDYVAVYQPAKLWDQGPPEATYSGRPVVRAIGRTSEAIEKLLPETPVAGRQ